MVAKRRLIVFRNILAVIAGLVVGSIVNMSLVMLNAYVLFPCRRART
jgi:hypothetical protein